MPPLVPAATFAAQFSGLLTSGLKVPTTLGLRSSEMSIMRAYERCAQTPAAVPLSPPPDSSVLTMYSLPFSWITYSVAYEEPVEPSPKSGSIGWSHQERKLM